MKIMVKRNLKIYFQDKAAVFFSMLSVIIIFAYYALMTMGNALARSGAMAPLLAVWIPNIVGLLAGGFLIRRASK